MLLVGSYRLGQILHLKSKLNYKLMTLRKELMNLQQYAGSLTGGISLDDMMHCPHSLFGRMMQYQRASHNSAAQGASQKMSMMLAAGMLNPVMSQIANPVQQRAYQSMVFRNLYNQERDRAEKAEEKLLHAKETKIQQEVAGIELQLSMLKAEEQTTKEHVKEEARETAPHYA